MAEQDFIKAGFTVVGTENNENKLLSFLKENYPNVIRDTEINLEELKTVLGLPIDEKVNGYGLNFVGRNFARAKYAQKTTKELSLNHTLCKDIDTTENLVLKGDNLDSLKILKNHYSGQIKCIYIDPPYNTDKDEFVYPDKFDKEEAEVLGLANLSDSDFARMDFSFKTKKSHNGWLAFMYPRLLLARELLSNDGVICITIDDNEQANLKLLCDDIFGEENFVAETIWQHSIQPKGYSGKFSVHHNYNLLYRKSSAFNLLSLERTDEHNKAYSNPDNDPKGLWRTGDVRNALFRPNLIFDIQTPSGKIIPPPTNGWRWSKETIQKKISTGEIIFSKDETRIIRKIYLNTVEGRTPETIWFGKDAGTTRDAAEELKELFEGTNYFDTPKPIELIKKIIALVVDDSEIILDFFAGSGTTGHAVMELNKDGGNRRYILCQIDEPIDPTKKKEAYDFCIAYDLEPVISSITIERLKRAGEKIVKDVEAENIKNALFETDKKQVPDIGFKVFDSIDAPKLKVDDKGQISLTEIETNTLSRIYNMIFTVGLDEPTQVPEEVVKDCIYKIGTHFYITNSDKITNNDYSNAIKNGKVFIDGWTASLNGTLQNYKEDVKVVF